MLDFFRKQFFRIKQISQFFGSKIIFWSIVTVISSFILVFVELSFALFLQFFMISMGISHSNASSVLSTLFSGNKVSLSFMIVMLFIIGIFRFLGFFFSDYSAQLIKELFTLKMRIFFIYQMIINPEKRLVSASEINYKLAELLPKAQNFILHLLYAFIYFIIIIALFFAMLYIAFYEAIICLIGLGVIGIIFLFINKKIRNHSLQASNFFLALQKGIERVARNWVFLKISRTQELEYHQHLQHVVLYFSNMKNVIFWSAFGSNLPAFIGIIVLVFIIWLSQTIFQTPSLILLSFLYLFIRFIQQLRVFTSFFSQVNEYLPQFLIIYHYFFQSEFFLSEEMAHELQRTRFSANQFMLDKQKIDLSRDTLKKVEEPPSIVAKNLSFIYERQSQMALNNLTLSIKGGSQVGIMGSSGSGKSTFLGLLLALFSATKGEILINNQSPEQFFQKNDLSIGYVGAEPFLFEGSIRENLLYGLERECSDEEIWKELEELQLANTIRDIPEQLDYQISENSEGLSTGQKQRLALGRALLRRPYLLLLDEVSANLDVETEKMIATYLSNLKGKCTTIIISHREGILHYTDQIIQLDKMSDGLSQ